MLLATKMTALSSNMHFALPTTCLALQTPVVYPRWEASGPTSLIQPILVHVLPYFHLSMPVLPVVVSLPNGTLILLWEIGFSAPAGGGGLIEPPKTRGWGAGQRLN